MANNNFIYNASAARVIFGEGSLQQLSNELDLLKSHRPLLLCTPGQLSGAENIAAMLGDRCIGIYDRAEIHVPAATVRNACDQAKSLRADSIVAYGGGSTIGLAKGIALELGLPILAIPTTYAGSEMTPIYGLTDKGLKTTGKNFRVLPKTVIYDPQLSAVLPVDISVASGLNAIAHAAEALYAKDANPITTILAEEGIRSMADGLRQLNITPNDLQARSTCLYGAWLCGLVLGNVGMALHHKLCHTLGGSFNLPHAQTHAVILPHAIAYNASSAPEAADRILKALGSDEVSAGTALYDFSREVNAPLTLRELGLTESDLDAATDISLANPYWNPRPLDKQEIRHLLQDAFEGNRPV